MNQPSSDMEELFQFRFITVKGNVYLRKEDVITYIRNIAATEETDTRNRLEEAANGVRKVGDERKSN